MAEISHLITRPPKNIMSHFEQIMVWQLLTPKLDPHSPPKNCDTNTKDHGVSISHLIIRSPPKNFISQIQKIIEWQHLTLSLKIVRQIQKT